MSPDRLRQVLGNRRVTTAAKIVFGVAVLTFGTIYVAGRWPQVRGPLRDARLGWLLLAAGFAVIGLVWAMFGTRLALQATSGQRLPVPAVARVFFVSQLGKYIPGSVWPIVAVAGMTARFRISATEAASAGLLAMFLSILTGGTVGALFLLAGGTVGGAGLWWLALLLPVAVAMSRPRLVFGVLNGVLKLIRRPPLSAAPSASTYHRLLGVTAASWIFLGLQCWAICVALGADPGRSIVGAVGGFALAYTAGTLFVPAPAGAGVREAVLGFSLAGVVSGEPSFQSGSVVAVVLMSRILLAVLDFLLAGLAVAVQAGHGAAATRRELQQRPVPAGQGLPEKGRGSDGRT